MQALVLYKVLGKKVTRVNIKEKILEKIMKKDLIILGFCNIL